MSCLVSFNAGLLLVDKQPVQSLGIDRLTSRCTKPSNNSNKYCNTNDSWLRLSKKKIIHRRLPEIRASSKSSELIKDEKEKDIYNGEIPEFKNSSDFSRLRKDETKRVDKQTAIVSYCKKLPGSIPQPGLQVALVTVCYFGNKEYYAELQQELDNYDRVLYRLIARKDHIKQSNRNRETRWIPPENFPRNGVSFVLERLVSSLFGLYCQMDCLDFRRDNWYNVYLDYDTMRLMLREAEKKHRDSELTKETNELSSKAITVSPIDTSVEMKTSSFATAEKPDIAQHHTEVFADLDAAKNYPVIVEERNKVVMEKLRAAISDGCEKIAILYGASHMLDMDRSLRREFDLVPTQISWKTAWSTRNRKGSVKKRLPLLLLFSLILAVLVALGVRFQFKKRWVR